MVERSWPWPGTTIGDAGPYSADDWDDMFERRFGSGTAPYGSRGVIRNWANELEVTDGGANTADVDTGAALVHGKHYDNDAVVNVVGIPAAPGGPGATWRQDTIFLRQVWATQTTRIYRHQNSTPETAYETPASVDGNVWYVPLAAVRINAAGAITLVTDLRDYVSDLMQPKEVSLEPSPYVPAGTAWTAFNGHVGLMRDDAGELARFEFKIPSDFLDDVEAYVVLAIDGLSQFDWTFYAEGAQCDGASIDRWSDSTTADNVDPELGFTCIDVSAAFDSGLLLADDIVGCRLVLDVVDAPEDISAVLLVFRYM